MRVLLQFVVENYRSFHGETVFSMVAPPGETVGTATVPGHAGLRVMRVAALYGANASGKSNLFAAIRAMGELVARGAKEGAELPAQPFRLSADARRAPTRFQVDFVTEGARFSYSIVFNSREVVGESLHRVLEGGDEALCFERESHAGGEHRVTLGAALQVGDEEQQRFVRFVAKATPVWQPMLTEFSAKNVVAVSSAHAWFARRLTTVAPMQTFDGLLAALADDDEMLRYFGERLRDLGTGIVRLDVETRQNLVELEVWKDLLDHGMLTVDGPAGTRSVPSRDVELSMSNGKPRVHVLLAQHPSDIGEVPFTLSEESDGTRRLLHLLPVLYDATRSDRTVVVDELDRSLHTVLTRRFVEEFMAAARTRDTGSQLIFTTHDTNLLNGRLVPPASIWFVEKDDQGATRLHALSEYRPAQLAQLVDHLEEGYLQGRFGAIPFLSPLGGVSWATESEA